MNDVVSRKDVLSILKTLLDQAEDVSACGGHPSAQEALEWAIEEVTDLPLSGSSEASVHLPRL